MFRRNLQSPVWKRHIGVPPWCTSVDKNLGGSLVFYFGQWWRHVKTIYRKMLLLLFVLKTSNNFLHFGWDLIFLFLTIWGDFPPFLVLEFSVIPPFRIWGDFSTIPCVRVSLFYNIMEQYLGKKANKARCHRWHQSRDVDITESMCTTVSPIKVLGNLWLLFWGLKKTRLGKYCLGMPCWWSLTRPK